MMGIGNQCCDRNRRQENVLEGAEVGHVTVYLCHRAYITIEPHPYSLTP